MTGRAVPEWIGATPDTPVPARVRLRVFEAHGGRCHRTGRKIMAGEPWQLDHVKALCNAPPGENWNRESNLAPILAGKPHKEKTAEDVAQRVKTDRMRQKFLGVFPKSKRPLRSRGFGSSR